MEKKLKIKNNNLKLKQFTHWKGKDLRKDLGKISRIRFYCFMEQKLRICWEFFNKDYELLLSHLRKLEIRWEKEFIFQIIIRWHWTTAHTTHIETNQDLCYSQKLQWANNK